MSTKNPALPESQLTKNQKIKKRYDVYDERGKPVVLVVEIRHDDQCGNRHNSFAITGDLYDRRDRMQGEPVTTHKDGTRLWLGSCGCLHDEIRKHAPELAPFIKWHLTSTDGPMHYVANTIYHATEHGPTSAWVYYEDKEAGITPRCMKYCDISEAERIAKKPGYSIKVDEKTAKAANLGYAKTTAVWPEATREQLLDKAALEARLPALMAEFRAAVESLGLIY